MFGRGKFSFSTFALPRVAVSANVRYNFQDNRKYHLNCTLSFSNNVVKLLSRTINRYGLVRYLLLTMLVPGPLVSPLVLGMYEYVTLYTTYECYCRYYTPNRTEKLQYRIEYPIINGILFTSNKSIFGRIIFTLND